ncbi:MAG: type II toxin-antitoxin system prevent-host-death family antitoxin [Xanthobacteraceae bacterium]|jgi:prevent-host-death family protein
MNTVSIKDAKNRLTELARLVEKGERVVVTRNGKPVFDLVPHRIERLRPEAASEFLKSRGVKEIFPYVADDFDEPLPEDVLLKPLP